MTLFLVFFAAPLGLLHTDPGSFPPFSMQWRMPLVRVFFFVLIGGSLFHGTHRLKFMLVDAGMRSPAAQAFLEIVLNGVAILGTLGGLYYMLKGWLI